MNAWRRPPRASKRAVTPSNQTFWLSKRAFIPLIAAKILSKLVNMGGEISKTRVVVVANAGFPSAAGAPKLAGARNLGAVAKPVVGTGGAGVGVLSVVCSSRGEGGVRKDGEFGDDVWRSPPGGVLSSKSSSMGS